MRDFIALVRGKIFTLICKIFQKNTFIGSGLKIYKKLSVNGKGTVYIGKNCLIHGVRGDRSQYVCIDTGNNDAVIRIGDNASLNGARINSHFEIHIGENVLIEEAGINDTDFHTIDKSREIPSYEDKKKCRITIGNRVCIGSKSMILKGVTVKDDVIIGPGSIVNKSIKSGSYAYGNPVKIIKINGS